MFISSKILQLPIVDFRIILRPTTNTLTWSHSLILKSKLNNWWAQNISTSDDQQIEKQPQWHSYSAQNIYKHDYFVPYHCFDFTDPSEQYGGKRFTIFHIEASLITYFCPPFTGHKILY